MINAGACRHFLDIARFEQRFLPHAVFVLKLAVKDDAHNFHIGVGMHVETGAGRENVVVNNAQDAESHVLRVIIAAERKGMIAV